MELKRLSKGDRAFVVYGTIIEEVVVSAVRVSKLGAVTYFVKTAKEGERYSCTFNEHGYQNFKGWREAVWCRVHHYLCDTMKDAKIRVRAYIKCNENK